MIRESETAIEGAISSSAPNTVICVTGSLYLVGEVRGWHEAATAEQESLVERMPLLMDRFEMR